MAITIAKAKSARGLLKQVQELSGVDVSKCYQCKKCTSGCPVSSLAKCPPSEMMRRLHLDMGEELLHSDILWMCVSCETCSARCPMGIDVAAVMDALRKLAVQRGAARPEGNVPLFNRAFLKTVEVFGRTYDMAMIAGYKLGSGKLLADTEKFPIMLKKRKIALLPPHGADRRTVRRIFKKTKHVAPPPSGVKNKAGQ
ncbi:MAG: heterodisulfide reductase subunit C [Planctomycetes bacterium]|nr:heterodisulfide reductase subunit C [Planctomycetota bacterium]